MGMIALALVTRGYRPHGEIPLWVTLASGSRWLLEHLVRRLADHPHPRPPGDGLNPIHGFAAEPMAAGVIQAPRLGVPISTTPRSPRRSSAPGPPAGSAVKWGVAGNIAWAWVLTLPAAAATAAPRVYLAGEAIRALF